MGQMTALLMQGFGTGFSAVSQVRAGNAEADVANYNAGLSDLKADDAVARGAEDESRFRTEIRRLIGSQRAGFAGQGVDVTVGSPVDVAADTAYSGELDALTIRTNAAREAWGHRTSAEDQRMRGRLAKQGGKMAAVETIITEAGSFIRDKYGFDRAGG